jgi:hypothetical protein
MLRVRACFEGVRTPSLPSLPDSAKEREREREREGERERGREKERDVEMSRIVIFIFKRNAVYLGTF